MKSAELLALLAVDNPPPNCAFLPEFRCGTGYSRQSRADAISMHLWPSAPLSLELIGYELKVSRSDWLREGKPGKPKVKAQPKRKSPAKKKAVVVKKKSFYSRFPAFLPSNIKKALAKK